MKVTGRLLALSLTAALVVFSGCNPFDDDSSGTVDLKCDSTGCLICEKYTCYEYTCGSNFDCPDGYDCQAQSCVPKGSSGGGGGIPAAQCDGTVVCPEGLACEFGACVTPTGQTPITECTMSTQCAAGTMCVDGVCKEDTTRTPTDPVNDCHVNADCDTGELCHNGECAGKNFPLRPEGTCQFKQDCGTTGTCLNTRCYFPPTADDQGLLTCPTGAVAKNGLCLPNLAPANECSLSTQCGPGSICVNATCVKTCDIASDCSAGNYCGGNSLCVLDDRPILQCLVNTDCAESCVDGRCVGTCTFGATETTCAENTVCTEHEFCMPNASCFEKSDCTSNFDCINGRCDTLGGSAPVDQPAPEAPEAE